MAAVIDLGAYFRRIGYEGDRAPTADVLRAVHLRHALAVPFENLDPLLGRPVRLDPPDLERKLVRQGRGGYCYEHNLLFRHALEGMGFRVAGLAARVLWNRPDPVTPARTHMLLRVHVGDEAYLADVGFGGQTLTAPLRLAPGAEQPTPHEPYRLVPAGNELVLQTRIRGEWRPMYQFDLGEHHQADYEVASWYLSNHPESPFVTGLMAARPAPGKRIALRDNVLNVHTPDGQTERQVLRTGADLRAALAGPLGVRLPDGPEVDALLDRLAARPG